MSAVSTDLDILAGLVRDRVAGLSQSIAREAIVEPLRAYAVLRTVKGLRDHREHVVALFLDSRRCVIGKPYVVSVGTASASLVHPREVFREAIKRGACSVILAHNHPSGDPTPSGDDLALTRRLRQAGELLGIFLADHIIVGSDCYVSLKQRGEL